jgi:hypothetical protein
MPSIISWCCPAFLSLSVVDCRCDTSAPAPPLTLRPFTWKQCRISCHADRSRCGTTWKVLSRTSPHPPPLRARLSPPSTQSHSHQLLTHNHFRIPKPPTRPFKAVLHHITCSSSLTTSSSTPRCRQHIECCDWVLSASKVVRTTVVACGGG